MRRISEALTEHAQELTRGQRVLAAYVTDHCDKAAFMSSFEMAAITGVSQSTVVRFAAALGYAGFTQLQEALQIELKYRLTALERLELVTDPSDDGELLSALSATDARNVRRNLELNTTDALRNLCTRLMFSSRVYIYGQGFTGAAAVYLASYLRILLPNVCCLNQTGVDPLTAMAGIDNGDLLICMAYPPFSGTALDLLAYAKEKEACIATVSEGNDSAVSGDADISLAAECGDYGIGGSLAPVISLCCGIVCLLARGNDQAEKRLRAAQDAVAFIRG
ncbi:MAG: MurR/RpiR family transcriptional regulator [Clostridiaceae bacterium]|nr:MurR/RpiR family transcriptional regulator [Clostridiaceae bacterium]